MSDLKEDLKYIADHCDPLELISLSDGYGWSGQVNGEFLLATGKTVELATFEMMDVVRNELHD